MIKKKYSYLIEILILVCLVVITISSLVYLYDVKDKILNTLKTAFMKNEKVTAGNSLDVKFANLILKGDYILFFRHTHREKWIDV